MSAASERPKNRTVKIVGGGSRKARGGTKSGGSVKAIRRALRKTAKAAMKRGQSGVAAAKAIKVQIQGMIHKPKRKAG